MKALICIKRGAKNRITYNSGILYFHHEESLEVFIKEISKLSKDIQVVPVDTKLPHEPKDTGKGYWCPYCRSWEYWKADIGSYKKCPICGISDQDFYVRQFNGLWVTGMQSQKAKRKSEGINTRRRRRTKKKGSDEE